MGPRPGHAPGVGPRRGRGPIPRMLTIAALVAGLLAVPALAGRMTRMRTPARRPLALAAIAAVALAGAVAVAPAKMRSTTVGPLLCETAGGGRFVDIPGFPGEMIDRRLLNDIRWLAKRYPIFITDGYSMSDVHSREGEHPLGLALDIVPNKAEGGTWADITRLARWAEPRQDRPRAPFRWVGYSGDAHHGPRDHLHLSWAHSPARPGRPAKLVNTLRCPSTPGGGTQPPTGGSLEGDAPAGGGAGGGGGGGQGGGGNEQPTGGSLSGSGSTTGGVGGKLGLAPPVPEADGVGLR